MPIVEARRRGQSDAQAILARWRRNRMSFRREAIVLEDGRRFGDVIEDWQVQDFRALDDPRHRHAYLERPRGHAKTFDVGTEVVTELVLGPPGARIYAAAADQDQATLLFDDVRGKFARNPLLAPLVKLTRTRLTVTATGSTLIVLASDAPSAYGLRPSLIVVDELAEWRGGALGQSVDQHRETSGLPDSRHQHGGLGPGLGGLGGPGARPSRGRLVLLVLRPVCELGRRGLAGTTTEDVAAARLRETPSQRMGDGRRRLLDGGRGRSDLH
jgi:Terminase large subunit, ATPase domain